MAIDTVRINGRVCSWQGTELTFNGERFHKFTAIDYGDKSSKSFVYGTEGKPIGITRGKYETDPLKVTGPKAAIQDLREFFATLSETDSYADATCGVAVLQFLENDRVITVEFRNVTWNEDTASHSEGTDALEDSASFYVETLSRDGKVLYSIFG